MSWFPPLVKSAPKKKAPRKLYALGEWYEMCKHARKMHEFKAERPKRKTKYARGQLYMIMRGLK